MKCKKYFRRLATVSFLFFIFCLTIVGQVDDICGEFGYIPSLEAPRLMAPYVFGRITVRGDDPDARLPKVSIVFQHRGQSPNRLTIGKSGNYCFKMSGGAGGTLVIDVDGVEVARRILPSMGAAQQREDFDIIVPGARRPGAPGVVSAKFHRHPNPRTIDLYKKAADAEEAKNLGEAVKHLREITAIDPEDFVAWGLLGGVYLERNELKDAEAALRKSLEFREDYTPAWVAMGRVRAAQKQYDAAIEIYKYAAELEPTYARTYQLLGEAYLLAKQGSLGAEALNKAIELDPVGMAEVHLQLAHLYQLAKANYMAAEEYRKLLEKVPDHPDRTKFERFIKDNEPK
jgi:predicted negative regulator of RcsB-dependent stress response